MGLLTHVRVHEGGRAHPTRLISVGFIGRVPQLRYEFRRVRTVLSFSIGPIGRDRKDRTSRATIRAQFAGTPSIASGDRANGPVQELLTILLPTVRHCRISQRNTFRGASKRHRATVHGYSSGPASRRPPTRLADASVWARRWLPRLHHRQGDRGQQDRHRRQSLSVWMDVTYRSGERSTNLSSPDELSASSADTGAQRCPGSLPERPDRGGRRQHPTPTPIRRRRPTSSPARTRPRMRRAGRTPSASPTDTPHSSVSCLQPGRRLPRLKSPREPGPKGSAATTRAGADQARSRSASTSSTTRKAASSPRCDGATTRCEAGGHG